MRVPSIEEEALRDLVRAREDVRGDLMRARHRVSKVLLRHDRRFAAGQQAWSLRHRDWLAQVRLEDPVAQLVLADYLASVEAMVIRRDELERRIEAIVPGSPWSELVPRLRCLRGIDTASSANENARRWRAFRAAHLTNVGPYQLTGTSASCVMRMPFPDGSRMPASTP